MKRLFTELRALQKKNNASFTLPWYGVIFGYILCGVCIANGVWWPYLYSIQWGKELSLEWLASLVFSIFQSIILLQPIKVSLSVLSQLYMYMYVELIFAAPQKIKLVHRTRGAL